MHEAFIPKTKGLSQIRAYFKDPSRKGLSFYLYVTFFKDHDTFVWISKKKYKRYSQKLQIVDGGSLNWAPENGEFTIELNYPVTVDKKVTHLVGLMFTFRWDFSSVYFVTNKPVSSKALVDSLEAMRQGVISRDGITTKIVKLLGYDIDMSKPILSPPSVSPHYYLDPEEMPF